MTVWAPAPTVAVKVIGLAWRGAELLVAEVEDSAGRLPGAETLAAARDRVSEP